MEKACGLFVTQESAGEMSPKIQKQVRIPALSFHLFFSFFLVYPCSRYFHNLLHNIKHINNTSLVLFLAFTCLKKGGLSVYLHSFKLF